MRHRKISLLNSVISQEKGLREGIHQHSSNQVTPELIDRLGLEAELEGHEGCVNCIDWDYTGQYIVTGSDDRTLLVWNPHTKMKIAHLRTQHVNNIFSVKFMPESGNRMIAAGAGDSKISLIDAERNETVIVCSCHLSRVKKLAVSNAHPTILWSGAEDGTVRQMDLREPHVCSETTSQILVNLLIHCGSMSEIKTIASNPVRSELLAVGAGDPYARLYDRRMINPYTCQALDRARIGRPLINRESSENKDLLPDGCVNYFIPGHVSCRLPEYRKQNRSITTTHVAFDSRGQKLLVNLGSEQIYLYDIFDRVPPVYLSVDKLQAPRASQSGIKSKGIPPAVKVMKEQANTAFEKGKYNLAVDLYNLAISKCPNSALLLSNKAAALMKRKWMGDVYDALRACLSAIELDPDYMKAYYRLARCLLDLKRPKEAEKVVIIFEEKFPDEVEQGWFKLLKTDLKAVLESLTAIENNGRAQSGSGYVEMSIEGNHYEIMARLNTDRNLSPAEVSWRKSAHDYERRFCGHCNTTTDIKEANFFGGEGQYVIAGSDDGSFFVWDHETTNIVKILRGDESIVNCLQPHPTTCLLATSGIDSVVRLWSPRPEVRLEDSSLSFFDVFFDEF
ncbi:WD and tetratricopeptide repeats protein 1-like isoform X2 [Artemia franciscana]|uniref:WD and tetratricopeptide repeats protein 1 n=1 Tax=Artemia franciscana TaxID=6661 RepID=A0AA88HIH6_ARTSF|nr:hypothetical protein QYM36_012188 [Artemia franciscana]